MNTHFNEINMKETFVLITVSIKRSKIEQIPSTFRQPNGCSPEITIGSDLNETFWHFLEMRVTVYILVAK